MQILRDPKNKRQYQSRQDGDIDKHICKDFPMETCASKVIDSDIQPKISQSVIDSLVHQLENIKHGTKTNS